MDPRIQHNVADGELKVNLKNLAELIQLFLLTALNLWYSRLGESGRFPIPTHISAVFLRLIPIKLSLKRFQRLKLSYTMRYYA